MSASTVLFVLALASAEAEPWSDKRLPIRDGLAAWYDAAAIPKTVADDAPVELWKDGSGQHRDVRAEKAEFRPTIRRLGESATVRFDGLDDALRSATADRKLGAFHLFVAAAPHANAGGFRGFFAANAKDRRDYQSGFCLDLTAFPSSEFAAVNVEALGAGGMKAFNFQPRAFGRLAFMEAAADPKAKKIRVTIDGKPAGDRPWTGEAVSLAEITVGARYYDNGPGKQHVDGWLSCDIAEVVLYDRALADSDAAKTRAYLQSKYTKLAAALPADIAAAESIAGRKPLKLVANQPPIQVLEPGFAVFALPVKLPNVNNLKYRADGKLFALCYNGDVYVLEDTNADGLEDRATKWFDNQGNQRAAIGMDFTPPNFPHGQGVIVASKGKISALVDTDRDGKADKEIPIAEGWKELPHGVDAVGVAVDPKDGAVYFGLGVESFTNAFKLDDKGVGHYRMSDPYCSVSRIAPDLKSRQVVATGVRFAVGMAFDKAGRLFVTDQEGATWLPNGNPFDELLWIQPGKHYGFPPRHGKHLPNAVDEPSAIDFEPQHQSTCGLFFNGVKGGLFGPEAWNGDAFVCGYSRGKMYRVTLAESSGGIIGEHRLFACADSLVVDACATPDAGMVVATHSGPPDWGTGPTGPGKLYKIRATPQPPARATLAWSTGTNEIAVAFDRPLTDAELEALKKSTMEAGAYVRAGDRFEKHWPGYQVVHLQRREPRIDVPILGTSFLPDRRTVLFATATHTDRQRFALTLPRAADATPNAVKQFAESDVDFLTAGVVAELVESGAKRTVWLPHPDLDVSERLTRGSALHEEFFTHLASARGVLRMTGKLDMRNLLRPVVQLGSTVDSELPPEKGSWSVESDVGFGMIWAGNQDVKNTTRWSSPLAVAPEAPQPWQFTVPLAGKRPTIRVAFRTDFDPRDRPLALKRFVLPWTVDRKPSDRLAAPSWERTEPELAGGSWGRGRKVFTSEPANCSKCHTIDGAGGKLGPDLSNIRQRDYASVLRDVARPNEVLNPDHLTYVGLLRDGRTVTGLVRRVGDDFEFGNDKAEVVRVPAAEVESLKPTGKSIMPEKLAEAIGPERMRDLMTYLLTAPPLMPRDYVGKRPKLRDRAELDRYLGAAAQPAAPKKHRRVKIVLLAGPKDHGPGEHDYPAWQKRWLELFRAADDVDVETAWLDLSEDQWRTADAILDYKFQKWTPAKGANLDKFFARGGGYVPIHWAVGGDTREAPFSERIGLSSTEAGIKFRHGPLDLTFNPKHPLAGNLHNLHFHDESYWLMKGKPERLNVLATGVEDGRPQPLFWTYEPSRGRVFVSILGHYSWTFDDPLFRSILLRGLAWTMKEPLDRFDPLATLGAEMTGEKR